LFALKLTLVPLLIAGITFAGHRWGPAVSGWLAGLPVVSGPVLLFIAIEQGPSFASTAAIGTLSGVVGAVSFAIIYAWVAVRFSWPLSLVCGLCAYFAVVALLYLSSPSTYLAALVTVGSLVLAPRLFPRTASSAAIVVSTYAELSCRMLAGAVLVVLVTHFSSNLGPRLSGLFAVFPVVTSVLAVFSHRYSGYKCTVVLLRGLVFGLYAFVAFCFVLALLLPALGISLSFLAAVICAVLVQFLSRFAVQRAWPK
jgi:hypothetical protein